MGINVLCEEQVPGCRSELVTVRGTSKRVAPAALDPYIRPCIPPIERGAQALISI